MSNTNDLCILAVSGRTGSGMTTLSLAIVDALRERGIAVQRFSLMQPTTSMLADAFGRTVEELESTHAKFETYPHGDMPFLSAAIEIHTAIRIGHSDTFTCSVLEHKLIQAKKRGAKVVVVDDLRLIAEKEFLEKKGAKFIRLDMSKFGGDAELYEKVVQKGDLLDTDLDNQEWFLTFNTHFDPKKMANAVLMAYRTYLGIE